MILYGAADRTYDYGTAERALGQMSGIDFKKRGPAFKAELRHLKNSGVPKLPKPGRGQKVSYTFIQLVELAMALQLTAVGIAPKRAATVALKAGRDIRSAGNFGERLFIIIPPGKEPITVDLDAPENAGISLRKFTQFWPVYTMIECKRVAEHVALSLFLSGGLI